MPVELEAWALTHAIFARQLLSLAQQHMEIAINSQPSGDSRNTLTDFNIRLMVLAADMSNLKETKKAEPVTFQQWFDTVKKHTQPQDLDQWMEAAWNAARELK